MQKRELGRSLKIKIGDRGREVADIQSRLLKIGYKIGSSGVDEVFGKDTEKAVEDFQKKKKLKSTGYVNQVTWRKLVEECYEIGDRLLYFRYPYFKGNDVKVLQEKLRALGFNTGFVDGIFGPQTAKALKEFQQSSGLPPDGVVGLSTIKVFEGFDGRFSSASKLRFPKRTEKGIQVLKNRNFMVDVELGKETDLKDIFIDLAKRFVKILKAHKANIYFQSEEVAKNIDNKTIKVFELGIIFSFKKSDNIKKGKVEICYQGGSMKKSRKLACEIIKELDKTYKDLEIKENNILLKNKKSTFPLIVFSPVIREESEMFDLLCKEEERQKIAISISEGIKNYYLTCKNI